MVSATKGPIPHLLQSQGEWSVRLSYPETKWLLVVMAFGSHDLDFWGNRAEGVGVGEMRPGVGV